MSGGVGTGFDGFGMEPKLLDAVRKLGFEEPTAIQQQSYTQISSGKDVVLGAETGSGKTLAYLLPIVNQIIKIGDRDTGRDNRPEALVLTPTQELSSQVLRVLDSLGLEEEVPGALVAGSHGYPKGQLVRVLVATPSGLLRHADPYLLAHVKTVVVDEADMLLDGGFVHDVDKIMSELKPVVTKSAMRRAGRGDPSALELKREQAQAVFAAATLPDWKGDKVKSVVRWITKRLPDVEFVKTEELHTASRRAEQHWVDVEGEGGEGDAPLMAALDGALARRKGKRTIVFVNTVAMAVAAHAHLTGGGEGEGEEGESGAGGGPEGFKGAQVLHRDMPQLARAEAIASFRAGLSDILVSTDVGARGLDIAGVDHVIQLELATNAVTHLHRIGRTARAGAAGAVTNIVSERSRDLAGAIRSGGDGPLAPVFSRNRGFNRRKKRQTGYGEGDGRAVLE